MRDSSVLSLDNSDRYLFYENVTAPILTVMHLRRLLFQIKLNIETNFNGKPFVLMGQKFNSMELNGP